MNLHLRTIPAISGCENSRGLNHLCAVGNSNTLSPSISVNDLQCGLSDQILDGLPNKAESIQIGNRNYPSSILELHRPTGKYISRILIRIFNLFSRKGIIRTVGNARAPGLVFPELEPNKGIEQFANLQKSCPIISVNTLGFETYPDSVTVNAEPFMVIDLPSHWRTFSDYLSAFSSKYRVRAKKVFEETKTITKSYLHKESPNVWATKCGALLAESLQDKTIAIGRNLPELLICYHQSLKDNYRIIGFYENDKIIGFISYIVDGPRMFAMHLGVDRIADISGKLYQRMLYTLVEESFELGISKINLGRTGAEIKSTLGAVPIQNSFVVFTRSKVLLGLFRLYAKYIQKKYQYTHRSPFKTSDLKAPASLV